MIWSKDCSLHEKCQKSVGAVEAIKQHSARDVIGPFGQILALWMIFNNSWSNYLADQVIPNFTSF